MKGGLQAESTQCSAWTLVKRVTNYNFITYPGLEIKKYIYLVAILRQSI